MFTNNIKNNKKEEKENNMLSLFNIWKTISQAVRNLVLNAFNSFEIVHIHRKN